MISAPQPKFDHLASMTDGRGTFEHARLTSPRPEHGYCTDDMARVLVVTARERNVTAEVAALRGTSLRFLRDAQGRDGGYKNRLDADGRWRDRPSVADCWGRSLWGLGSLIARVDESEADQAAATLQFARSSRRRSPWMRAMAFAGIGAAELLSVDESNDDARALLADAGDGIPEAHHRGGSPWPEPRLAYANAVVPEVLIAAGSVLERPRLLRRGLELLRWLLDHEMLDGHLSVTPAGGSALAAPRPAFDQQPIEVAALADACARAATVDTGADWSLGVAAAIAWFLGDNDGHHLMWDPATGGGFDGLEPNGVNRNQGTESTLALLATLQHAHRPVTASL